MDIVVGCVLIVESSSKGVVMIPHEITAWIIEGGFALGMLTFMWKINSEMQSRTNAIFRRFDEHKEYIANKLEKDYVSKDLCHLMHEHGTNDFRRVEHKIDSYHAEMTRRIEKLEGQILGILRKSSDE